MSRFSNTFPGVPDWTREMVVGSRSKPSFRSTTPASPNVRIDWPVVASMAWR